MQSKVEWLSLARFFSIEIIKRGRDTAFHHVIAVNNWRDEDDEADEDEDLLLSIYNPEKGPYLFHVVLDIIVGIDMLDIFEVFQGINKAQNLFRDFRVINGYEI